MKKFLFTIIMFLIIHAGFSQTSMGYQSKLDSVSKMVIHYLQTKQTDSIYALAGEQFRNQIDAKNFNSVLDNQIYPLNDFQHITYVNVTNGINKYKIAGTPELQLLISIDKDNKLETFLIQPFSDN